jgi:hypothetical protein
MQDVCKIHLVPGLKSAFITSVAAVVVIIMVSVVLSGILFLMYCGDTCVGASTWVCFLLRMFLIVGIFLLDVGCWMFLLRMFLMLAYAVMQFRQRLESLVKRAASHPKMAALLEVRSSAVPSTLYLSVFCLPFSTPLFFSLRVGP